MFVRHPARAAALLLLVTALPVRAADPYAIKVLDQPPPKELAEPVRKLLGDRAVQLLDVKGQVLAEVWFRKDVPAKGTGGADGLTYSQVPETTVLGAMRVVKTVRDYRKQKVPAGVYTLRLGAQPMDGDHMGTAPFGDFLLASPAKEDAKPGPMNPKELQELSAKTTNAHPAVFLLFPGKGTAAAAPKLVSQPGKHWVLYVQVGASAAGKKTTLPIGLTLIGASSSA